MSPRQRLVVAGGHLAVALTGVFLSAVTTIHHRSLPPWGALLGVAVIGVFGWALRLLRPGRSLALAGMASVAATGLALSASWDGSLVVTAQPLGVAFTLGVIVACVLAVSWPDLRQLARYDGNSVVEQKEDRP